MIGLLACCSVLAAAQSPRPLLLFEIDEGFSTSLLGKCRNDPAGIDKPIDNIKAALQPLASKYDVAVLVYPTYAYSKDAEGRVGVLPVLRRLLNKFKPKAGQPKIGVLLELMSSGIASAQQHDSGLKPPFLGTGSPDKPRLGLSLDMATLGALADEYKGTLVGIRFHEVYGSDVVWRVTPENQKAGFPFDTEAVRACIDVCAKKGLRFLWSDSNWLMKCPPNTGEPHYIYSSTNKPYFQTEPFASLQTEAEQKLGSNVCFSWANNNYHFTPNLAFLNSKIVKSKPGVNRPVPDWILFDQPFNDFPLKNLGKAQWGMSVQSWFWHELTYTLTGHYYSLGELACPEEVLSAYVHQGLRDGASILQFEPSWYFFNEAIPGRLGAKASCERTDDMSEKLAFKRLKKELLGTNPSQVPDRLDAMFDRDQQRFHENDVANPPRMYAQTTLAMTNPKGVSACYGRYSFKAGWLRNDADRILPAISENPTSMIDRCEIDGDGVDEILAWNKNKVRFYNANSGELDVDLDLSAIEGEVVDVVATNLDRKMVGGGDSDELIVAYRQNSTIKLQVYQMAAREDRSGYVWKALPTAESTKILSLEIPSEALKKGSFLKMVALRQDAKIYADGSRSLDRLAVLAKQRVYFGSVLKPMPKSIPANRTGLYVRAADIHLAGKDSLLMFWRSVAGQWSVRKLNLADGTTSKVGLDLNLKSSITGVFALRKRILLNGGSHN